MPSTPATEHDDTVAIDRGVTACQRTPVARSPWSGWGVLPDAPNAPTFWENLKAGRCSITETPDGRWDPALYYDPDPHAPDKTYSKIGGWVREYDVVRR